MDCCCWYVPVEPVAWLDIVVGHELRFVLESGLVLVATSL